jgi:hypothetical protein
LKQQADKGKKGKKKKKNLRNQPYTKMVCMYFDLRMLLCSQRKEKKEAKKIIVFERERERDSGKLFDRKKKEEGNGN